MLVFLIFAAKMLLLGMIMFYAYKLFTLRKNIVDIIKNNPVAKYYLLLDALCFVIALLLLAYFV